uniref:Uncharacterized protein n=1 Tax=Timema poppense TaxID=170557 RepID=A0A7R9CIV9_TIMPO|nr:unnamed protein product [Timema poppensis]
MLLAVGGTPRTIVGTVPDNPLCGPPVNFRYSSGEDVLEVIQQKEYWDASRRERSLNPITTFLATPMLTAINIDTLVDEKPMDWRMKREREEIVEKLSEKPPGRDSNLDLTVIGSLIQNESSAIYHLVTEVIRYNCSNILISAPAGKQTQTRNVPAFAWREEKTPLVHPTEILAISPSTEVRCNVRVTP